MNIIPKWLFNKHQPKTQKQAITPAVVDQNTKEVIDCIILGLEKIELIRKPNPEIKSPIHGASMAMNKNGNFTAIRFRDVTFEAAWSITSEIHIKYQLGATDEAQAVSVMIYDEMASLLAVINKSILVFYPQIKTSDSVEVAKVKFNKMLNNGLRAELQKFFATNKRLIDAVSNFKSVNYMESFNVTENTISNFLSRKSMKTHGRIYEDLLNDKPANIPFKAKEEPIKAEPSIDDIMGDE